MIIMGKIMNWLDNLSWITRLAIIFGIISSVFIGILARNNSLYIGLDIGISKIVGIIIFILSIPWYFYSCGLLITGFFIMFEKLHYTENERLRFWDWYSHIRFWSFLLWFFPLFWLYVPFKIYILEPNNPNKFNFKNDRFYLFGGGIALLWSLYFFNFTFSLFL